MFDIFIMDMGGHDDNVQGLVQRFPHARVVRYYDNHLNTVRRCISRSRTPYAWILSSCCDYANFDFEYRAVPWESYQLHCWASGDQKFGDTFLVNNSEFDKQQDIELLEWYKDVHSHEDGVPRLAWPKIIYETDDLVNLVKDTKFDTPYIEFTHDRTQNLIPDADMCLWTEKQRILTSFSTGNQLISVPNDVKRHLKTQLYDYAYIDKRNTYQDKNIDIVYISNGEPDAERWFDNLQAHCGGRAKRVDGVNGRTQAYQTAAQQSETEWFFAVFAKLEVLESFDWTWQPDFLQQPKHYIFYSRNPVNDLEYGHMGIIAYNKNLVLDTNEPRLDFTLSREHTVVPVVGSVAHFNTTPELTWRTAFREAIKLKDDVIKTGSIESQHRLKVWSTQAKGDHAEWSIQGAQDAVEYYESVDGDYGQLMLSYEWAWLEEHFKKCCSSLYSQL